MPPDRDPLQVILEKLDKTDYRLQAIDAKVDASRTEAAHRGAEQTAVNKRIEADVSEVRHEVKNLAARVGMVEGDVRELRDIDADITRSTSEHDLAHEAALGGAIAHVRTLDQNFGEIRESMQTHARVTEAVCEVLGLDYDAAAAPPKPGAEKTKPKADLVKMARENQWGAAGAILAFLTVAIELALKILH